MRIEALTPYSSNSFLSFKNCRFGQTHFSDIDFRLFENLGIFNCVFALSTYSALNLPKSISSKSRKYVYEAWLELLRMAQNNGSLLDIQEIHPKVSKEFFATGEIRPWDKPMRWVLWMNNHGERWEKSLMLTILFSFVSTVLIISIEYYYNNHSLCDIFQESFFHINSQLISPWSFSGLKQSKVTICHDEEYTFSLGSIYFYMLAKAIISIGYFQTIVAFRKFFKK